jgi:hypothetical protein
VIGIVSTLTLWFSSFFSGRLPMAKYVVWVGGIEVNDFYTTWNEAVDVALVFINDGYNDVQIERVKVPDLSLMV